jgi:hypothetical protein
MCGQDRTRQNAPGSSFALSVPVVGAWLNRSSPELLPKELGMVSLRQVSFGTEEEIEL